MKYSPKFKKSPKYKSILAANNKWYEKNKEKRKEQMKDYWNINKEQMSSYKHNYYVKNKERIKQKTKEYRIKNKDKLILYRKAYWENNKEKLKEKNAIRNRIWYASRDKKAYRTKKRIWEKKHLKDDVNFAIKKRLRIRVWQKLKGIKKGHSDEYGIDYDKIAEHLNKTMPLDYKQNPSKYEVDHIIPLSKFNLKNKEEILKAFAPENHQWLTASDKSKKKDKMPLEWENKKQKNLYTFESNISPMVKEQNKVSLSFKIPSNFKKKTNKRKVPRPTDLNPSYSHIAGDPTKNERINFKHWNDLLFGKDNNNDTTYSNIWLYRNPQKYPPFRDDIGSPSQTQAKAAGKQYFSEFNPLIAENILNFWSDEGDVVLDPFAGRTRSWVSGLKHRRYIGFEISPIAYKSTVKVLEEGKDKFDEGYYPTLYCDDSMNIPKYDVPNVDLILTCPPYFSLEKYESVPGQLSDIKEYNKFLAQYKTIMKLSIERLKDNGFCALVVGDYRIGDKFINFDYDTVRIMEELGVRLWDKIIIQNISFGWAGIKFGHIKHKRITSKVTEYLLIFKKY